MKFRQMILNHTLAIEQKLLENWMYQKEIVWRE